MLSKKLGVVTEEYKKKYIYIYNSALVFIFTSTSAQVLGS